MKTQKKITQKPLTPRRRTQRKRQKRRLKAFYDGTGESDHDFYENGLEVDSEPEPEEQGVEE